MSKDGSFESLRVWQNSVVLRKRIFSLTRLFPKHEKYNLIDQILRSSRSISANIVEGHGRFHYKENIQFCRIARGSLMETLNHLINANECGYISGEELNSFRSEIINIQKMLNGYIKYLNSKANSK